MSSSGVLLFTVLLMGYLYWSLAQPTSSLQIRCRITPPVPDPEMCIYGAYTSYCNKLACKQGPGQPCGTDRNRDLLIKFGECAEGLDCCNGKCLGCYRQNCYGVSCNPLKRSTIGRHIYGSPAQQLPPFYTSEYLDYFNQ